MKLHTAFYKSSYYIKRVYTSYKNKAILALLVGITSVLISNLIIMAASSKKTYFDINKIPKNNVGLVLGATKYLKNGRVNLFYKYRIDAAVKLYNSGKINFILVSGDNSSKTYDEPTTFKNDLIKRGIPASKIILDYAGFRTLDSMVRAKAIFGQDSITVISQKFHNERAIFIAQHHSIKAIGFNAKTVSRRYSKKTLLREYFARAKAVLDIITRKEPRFYGKKSKEFLETNYPQGKP